MKEIQIEYFNYVCEIIKNSEYYNSPIISEKIHILVFKSNTRYFTDANLRYNLDEIMQVKITNNLDIVLEHIEAIRKIKIITYDSYLIFKRKKLINNIFE